MHVVNLLAMDVELDGGGGARNPSISNILAFSGQVPALATPGYLVVVNSWNTHPELGSLALLNCHRVVYPLSFGGPKGQDDWTLADWCDQCHRKSGLVVWSQTAHESQGFLYGEPLADLLLGKIDAFEIDHFEGSPFDEIWLWYDLLNAGWRVPLAGASGKDSNASALGVMRTFVNLLPAQKFSYSSWIEALCAGRNFVSNGPILLLTVNGHVPGSIVALDGLGGKIHVHATCQTQSAAHRLEILFNGEIVGAASNAQTPTGSVFDADLAIGRSGWLAARCIGEARIFDKPANQQEFAHTSPIYLEAHERPAPHGEKVIKKFQVELERMEAWVKEKARCETAAQRQRLVNIFVAARERLLR